MSLYWRSVSASNPPGWAGALRGVVTKLGPAHWKQMDRITPDKRSWNMSRICGANTQPEIAVRSALHKLGFRFSLRRKDLPGKPDIVLPARGAVVLVHGCFWHRHPGCTNSVLPKTRTEFWATKLGRNVDRDQRTLLALTELGWRVLTVWECEIAGRERLEARLTEFLLGASVGTGR